MERKMTETKKFTTKPFLRWAGGKTRSIAFLEKATLFDSIIPPDLNWVTMWMEWNEEENRDMFQIYYPNGHVDTFDEKTNEWIKSDYPISREKIRRKVSHRNFIGYIE